MFFKCLVTSDRMCPYAFILVLTHLITDTAQVAWEQEGTSCAHCDPDLTSSCSVTWLLFSPILWAPLAPGSPISFFLPLSVPFSYVQYFCLCPIITRLYFITFYPICLAVFPLILFPSPSLPSSTLFLSHLSHCRPLPLLTPLAALFFHSAAESHQVAVLSTKKTGTCLWIAKHFKDLI